jgi:hypothetical protein
VIGTASILTSLAYARDMLPPGFVYLRIFDAPSAR